MLRAHVGFAVVFALTLSCLWMPGAAQAASASISLTQHSGPPTSHIAVTGSGFAAHEAVAITFGAAPVGKIATASNGAFAITIAAPASAQPGAHTITATGLTSRRSAATAFLVQTDWAMWGGDSAHTAFNRYENTISASNVGKLTVAWTFQLPSGESNGASPVEYAGRLYYTVYHRLYALNPSTGRVIWQHAFPDNVDSETLAAADNRIFISPSYDSLYALDATTGQELWRQQCYAMRPTLVVAYGVVYDECNNEVDAFSAKSGQLLWHIVTHNLWADPIVANGMLYTPVDDALDYVHLTAFDARTGKLRWSIAQRYSSLNSLAESNGVIYVGYGASSTLVAYNALTGHQIWQNTRDMGGQETYAHTPVAYGILYVDTGATDISAFSIKTGALLWRTHVGIPNCDVCSSPIVANGVLYMEWGKRVYAMSAFTGVTLWSYQLEPDDDRAYSIPMVANGMLFAADMLGKLSAFRLPGA